MKKILYSFVLFTLSVVLMTAGQPAQASTTYTVDIDRDEFDGSCSDGDCSLRDAVILANANPDADIIVLTQSVNTLDIVVGSSANEGEDFGDLDIRSDITIIGGGGEEITVDQNNLQERVFEVHSGAHLTLDSLNVSEGIDTDGGLIYNSGDLTLQNVDLTGGEATPGNGGAIYNDTGATIFMGEDNTFIYIADSTAASRGGAVYSEGDITFIDALIDSNTAASGAGIYVFGSVNTTLNRVTMSGNTAASRGGALFTDSATSTSIEDSLFGGDDPSEANTAAFGGGIVANGAFTMSDSAVVGNQASSDGGGIWIRNAFDGLIQNSTISSNTAGRDGGGISFQIGAVAANFSFNTIVANTATGTGAGIDFGSTAVTQMLMKANVVNGNTLTTGTSEDLAGTIAIDSEGYNKIGTVVSYDTSNWNTLVTDEFNVAPSLNIDLTLTPATSESGQDTFVHPYYSRSGVGVDAITDSSDCSLSDDQLGIERGDLLCDAGAHEFNVDNDTDGFYEWEDECDNDPFTFVELEYALDTDGDGYGSETTVFACPSEQPVQTILLTDSQGVDECDQEFGVTEESLFVTDEDGDGFGEEGSEVSLCPAQTSTNQILSLNSSGADQCDLDADTQTTLEYVADADGDGYGDSETTEQLCPVNAQGYILASTSQGVDVDSTDATVRTEADLPEEETPAEDTDSDETDDSRSTTELSDLDVTSRAVYNANVDELEGRRNGIARVTLTNGTVLNHELFSRGRRTIKVKVLPESGVGVAIAGGGKRMKMFNPYTGEIYDTVRLSKKKRKARNMKFLNLRRQGKKIVVSLKAKKKAKQTRVVVVGFNTDNQSLNKRGGKNIKGIKATRVRKTKRGRKKNRVVLKNKNGKTKAILKVKKNYSLKRVR
jgi:parallel beta-helix repeat protein/predicted outer membrane repeat protein